MIRWGFYLYFNQYSEHIQPALQLLPACRSFIVYCIRTLPRGGMYWKIHSPRPKRFPKGGDFASPRPERWPEGIFQSRGPSVFSNTSLLSAVYGYNTQ